MVDLRKFTPNVTVGVFEDGRAILVSEVATVPGWRGRRGVTLVGGRNLETGRREYGMSDYLTIATLHESRTIGRKNG